VLLNPTFTYNVSVNNTTLYFTYNKNSVLSGRHVSAFIRSSSGPLGKQIQELFTFQCTVHILKTKSKTKFLYCLLYTIGFNLPPSQIIFNLLMLRPSNRLQHIQT